ncbi:hypothetical protein WQ54_00520 [Bacillus sp. SA1-12]|uniref:YesL family protein n=1 Tax=Bacillus sp. SA1-12 TaxID=1455638 RepID=UPI000625D613|nr:DUF624 domain-containing protein [Bacillus sp. SA1-12]KKI94062.1 hypothetical protein WQ54_00520 [Bacillus sp. SA1-12]
MNKLMNIFDWIYRLLYLNALWVLFTIAGLGVFGLFPSTVSMFYVANEWVSGNKDIPVFKTFFIKFKEEFFRSQLLGIILTAAVGLLYFDLQFFFQKEGTFFFLLRYLMLTVGFLFVIMVPFMFPLYVQARLSFGEFFKNVLFMSITRIFQSAVMVVGCITIFVVFSKFAGLFIFFLGSTLAFWLTWNTKIAFHKIQQKRSLFSNPEGKKKFTTSEN